MIMIDENEWKFNLFIDTINSVGVSNTIRGYLTFESTFWSWKLENFGFYIMEVLLLTCHLLSSKDFCLRFASACGNFGVQILSRHKFNPEILATAEITFIKKMKFFSYITVLNCLIRLVSRQFVHTLKICQYVNLSTCHH